ncbi:MAG: SAM domain-containing protein [Myxococcota bacterium]
MENFIDFQRKSRFEVVQEAVTGPCTCQGEWAGCARQILRQNDISESSWCEAVATALREGRAKGTLVCHAGLHGNEGKSFLLRPLLRLFGPDGCFVAPPSKSAFPLLGLEKARLALLDDWRFNDDIIPYSLQLLWFEGAPFVISRPQNHFAGHLRYCKDDPVFITTLLSDLTEVKAKKGLQQGDVDMMMKRLLVFQFTRPISLPKNVVYGCGPCFAQFVLGNAAPAPAWPFSNSTVAPPSTKPQELRVEDAASWSVAAVVAFLEQLSLGHLAPNFQESGIDGQMLCELSMADLIDDLGLKALQARKIVSRWA